MTEKLRERYQKNIGKIGKRNWKKIEAKKR